MSGAGRTQVANALEDLGWFVIDNLPASLIPKVAELAQSGGGAERVALVVGSGARLDDLKTELDDLRSTGARIRVVFLDASTDALVARYESTKRRHPFAGSEGVVASITAERSALDSLRASADLVIDTTNRNVHDLRAEVVSRFGENNDTDSMQTSVVSFGYKHGIPRDVDIVIDCRFLANPYWNNELRPLTGLDEQVREFVYSQTEAGEFLDRLVSLLELLVPAYRSEGKAYLTIAFGCTGGRHRSVAIAESVAERLGALGVAPQIRHRDVTK